MQYDVLLCIPVDSESLISCYKRKRLTAHASARDIKSWAFTASSSYSDICQLQRSLHLFLDAPSTLDNFEASFTASNCSFRNHTSFSHLSRPAFDEVCQKEAFV